MIAFLLSRRKFVVLLSIGVCATLFLTKTLFAEVLQGNGSKIDDDWVSFLNEKAA